MRPAPPLALQCAPSRAWRWACAFLGGAAAAAVAGWTAAHLEWPVPLTVGFLLGATVAGMAGGRRVAGPLRSTELRWDGHTWQVDGERGTLEVMLDLDRWLLLRLRPSDRARRARWIALAARPEPGRQGLRGLRGLRTALYSSAPEETLDDKPHVRAPDRAED